MITDYVEIANADGIHTFNLNDVTSPLNLFDPTVADRSDAKRYKPQQAGSWPTRSYEGEMIIHMEGALFADTSADYITLRKSLILALRGVPGDPVVAYQRGLIFFKPVGEAERWFTNFGPAEISIPVRGNFPSLTEFMITLESNVPWFTGEDTGNRYWWS